MKNINPTQTAAWQALQKHFDEMKDVTIADLFAKDGDRFSKFSATFDDQMLVDYSKNRITEVDNFKFVKENEVCRILSYKGKVFGVEPPTFVTLEVTETEPGLKGNTATNTLKPAKVETGAEIRVPLFINEGDMIRIDTRTCEYMERA